MDEFASGVRIFHFRGALEKRSNGLGVRTPGDGLSTPSVCGEPNQSDISRQPARMVARERIRTLERLQRLLITAILVVICFGADGRAFASDENSVQRALAAGQQAMLERHYGEAVRVLRDGLKDNPKDNRLRLELGRAYLFSGADSRAIRLFREILRTEPDHRLGKMEVARALGYGRHYAGSNEIYKQLLSS